MVKKERSRKEMVSIYQLPYPHLYSWLVGRERKNTFPNTVSGLSLWDMVRSSVIWDRLAQNRAVLIGDRWGDLGIWSGCNLDISLVMGSGQVPPGGDPRYDPWHTGDTLSSGWPGNVSKITPEELKEVAGKKEIWASCLKPLIWPQISGRRWMEGSIVFNLPMFQIIKVFLLLIAWHAQALHCSVYVVTYFKSRQLWVTNNA